MGAVRVEEGRAEIWMRSGREKTDRKKKKRKRETEKRET